MITEIQKQAFMNGFCQGLDAVSKVGAVKPVEYLQRCQKA
jgi:hypothetical protein